MPFPLDYRGDVRWRGKTKLRGDQLQREVLHALATALRGAKGTVTVTGSTVSFTTERSHRFRQSNILLPIGHGELKVTLRDDTVVAEYTFNVQPLVAMASTLALGALAAVATSAEPLAVRTGFPAVIWVVVFGMHYLSTIVRFRGLITRALERM